MSDASGTESPAQAASRPASPQLEDRNDNRLLALRTEQLKLLYASSPAALAATVVAAITLVAVEWTVVPPGPLLAWLAYMLTLTASRFMLARAFQRAAPWQQKTSRWQVRFLIGVVLAGLGWGSAAFLLFPESSAPHQVFLIFMLGGMTAGAVSTLSAKLGAFLCFALPTMAPAAIHLWSQGTPLASTMAVMVVIFTLVLTYVTARVQATVVRSLELRLRNIDLLDQLRMHTVQREQAELARAASDRRFQFFVDQATDIIYRTDQTGRFTFINAVAARLMQYSDTEILGRHFAEFIRPDYHRTVQRFYDRQFVRKTPTTYFELPALTKDGRELWIGQNVQVLTDQGRVIGFQAVARDITERKRAEASSRESEARYRALYDNNPSMYFTVDAAGIVRSVNRFGAQYLGYAPDELINGPVSIVIHAEDRAAVRRQVAACFQQPDHLAHCEFRKIRKNGSMLWVKETIRAAHDADGHPVVFIVCEDITEHKRAEDRLQATSQQLETLIQASPLAIMSLDTEGNNIVRWNRAAEQIFGWREEEVLGRSLPNVPPGLKDESDALWNQAVREGFLRGIELQRLRKDGALIDIALWVTIVKDAQGRVTDTFGIVEDITDRKRVEEALHLSERALRRALREREQLARNLHDNIIQSIYAIGFTLEECQRLAQETPADANRKLDQVITALNHVIREVRGYIVAPVEESETLSADELVASLQRLGRLMENANGMRFSLTLDPAAAGTLTADQRAQLLYVAQEAMSNSLRHSGASTARVSLACIPHGVRFEILDNGVGFALQRMRNGNGGLKNIRLRARKIGANLDITSHPMEGTVISVEIPTNGRYDNARKV